MKSVKVTLLCLLILFLSQNLFSQLTKVSEPTYGPTREQRIWMEGAKRNEEKFGGKDQSGMMKQPPPITGSHEPFEGSRESAKAKTEEAKAITLENIEDLNKKFTAPQEYLKKYPQYANGQKSGIFRLYPERNCGQGRIVSVTELERCGNLPQILGFGSKMSFRLSEYPLDQILGIGFLFAFPDIYFSENSLKVGNELMETLAVEMGDADLDKVDSNSEAVKFLLKWKKSQNRKTVISHKQVIDKGIIDNGYVYSSSVPVKLNSVYALRSIFYYSEKSQKYKTFWNTDLLVAFKVVGQEKDGSIILVWKQLRKKDAPRLY